MSEERANIGRLTGEGFGAPAEGHSLPLVSSHASDGERADARRASSPGASEVVAVRMHRRDLAALGELQRQLGGSRSEAVRNAVEIVAQALSDSASIDAAAGRLSKHLASLRPTIVRVDESMLTDIRDGLCHVANRYSQQAFQLQKIGNNWNQVARLANLTGSVDPDALYAVERALDGLRRTMQDEARRDAKVAQKMQEALLCQ